MKKFTVITSKWFRGNGIGGSYLYRPEDGKMCCLGFLGEACGLSKEELANHPTPGSVSNPEKFPSELIKDNGGLYKDNSTLSLKLMLLNDSVHILEQERRSELAKLFKSIDIEVTFQDS